MATNSAKTLFDLPVEDILVDNVGKYLDLGDIYKFGKCSKDCKVLANSMAAKISCLHLKDDFNFYDVPEAQLPDFMSWISQNCRHLKIIFITNFTHAWPHNHFLIELLNNNDELLSFRACSLLEDITHTGNIPLFPLATRKNLKELVLMRFNFDDNFLIKFTENNNQLRRIIFNSSMGFSEKVLLEFLKMQPHLEHIDLRGCDIIISDIDSFISVIKNACPKLGLLEISDIKGVTTADISRIKEKLAKDQDNHFRLV
ncbi:uncharacterized protein LOC129798124 [Phlebotomus papatasi]|uniref:uncharacterized protein LOC129798124 n=1 Tax=Phlebotomus papatasi TaxID=29031 RepID=UPI002483E11E|nr:uncharacterized protein LOC129798124 [Phlebotomus papatasi]